MRWTLDDIYPACESYESDLGNVDPLRTMLLCDSAAARTLEHPRQKTSWIMRGGVCEQIV